MVVRLGLVVLLVACGGGGDKSDTDDYGTTPVPNAGDTADSARGPRIPPNPFDATNVAFEFDGILTRDGELTGYWNTDSAHVEPDDWNPPTVEIRFADELLFDDNDDPDDVIEAHTCYVRTEYEWTVEDDLENDNDADVHAAFEGWLDMFYYETGGDRLTFTDCAEKLDEATWGAEGRDLWQAFDGARFGLAFGDVSRTDLSNAWTPDAWAEYQDGMVASYVAFNRLDDSGELEYLGDAMSSCLLFEYDAATGELVDSDDDGQLELMDISAIPENAPLPEAYVRCFGYWWASLDDVALDRLPEGANGGPVEDTGG